MWPFWGWTVWKCEEVETFSLVQERLINRSGVVGPEPGKQMQQARTKYRSLPEDVLAVAGAASLLEWWQQLWACEHSYGQAFCEVFSVYYPHDYEAVIIWQVRNLSGERAYEISKISQCQVHQSRGRFCRQLQLIGADCEDDPANSSCRAYTSQTSFNTASHRDFPSREKEIISHCERAGLWFTHSLLCK